jgi:hypothetical protein
MMAGMKFTFKDFRLACIYKLVSDTNTIFAGKIEKQ